MKCAVCGKRIRKRPRLFHRQTGERVCRDCCNACYHSEAWLKYKKDPEAVGGMISYKDGDGAIKIRCGIQTFVRRLYDLEEKHNPEFRFTRMNDRTGHVECRALLEAMLRRLYEYEHSASGPITHMLPSGEITHSGNYDSVVERLCQLEDRRHPSERYTIRMKNGEAFPRRGIELVLSRLYDYEHFGGDETCR